MSDYNSLNLNENDLDLIISGLELLRSKLDKKVVNICKNKKRDSVKQLSHDFSKICSMTRITIDINVLVNKLKLLKE